MRGPRVQSIILIGLLMAVRAHANGATYASVAGNVYPVKNEQIRMVSERVDITETEFAGPFRFRCRFVFHNTGDSTTVQMGFPIGPFTMLPVSFTASVDGIRALTAPAIEERDGESDDAYFQRARQVYLWPVTFGDSAIRTVDVEYLLGPAGMDMALYGSSISYVLKTGALWKGPIGRGEIVLRFAAPMPRIAVKFSPERAVFEGDSIKWTFMYYTPEEDISVAWSGHLREKFAGRFVPHPARPGESPHISKGHPLAQAVLDLDLGEDEVYMGELGERLWDVLAWVRLKARNTRNEIYARNGYVFRDRALAEYYGHQAWYRPRPSFRESDLTEIERLNVDYCLALEAIPERGVSREQAIRALRDVLWRYW